MVVLDHLARLVDQIYADYPGTKAGHDRRDRSAKQGGRKAAWFDSIRKILPTRFPAIGALVFFEANKEVDWTVHSQPQRSPPSAL